MVTGAAMRYLEVRRHTGRDKPNPHVNQAGVALARRLGERMGPFARVWSSPSMRAIETALAMGFAVTDEAKALETYGDAVEREVRGEMHFADWARAVRLGDAATRFAREQAAFWHKLVEHLRDGEAGLAVSHGGVIELGAMGCLPDADHESWGPALWICEGVRVSFEAGRAVHVEILRVERE